MKTSKFPLTASALFLLLLTACSPRVITEITKAYPPITSADSVTIYELGETLPNSSEPIGKVAVVDGGSTTKCKYDQVLRIAQEETAKAGGNGLAITEYRRPSFWGSSCHQIEGTMLRINDWTIDPQAPNPVAEAISITQGIRKERAQKRRAPANTLSLSTGFGYVYSEIYTPYRTYKGKAGLDWKLDYNRIYSNGLGFGLQYSGFRTTYPEGGYMLLTYIAPSFIGRAKISNAWILKYGVGIGYFGYSDSGHETLSGVGVDISVGAEYMVSKHVGLGIDMQTITSSLPKQDGVDLGENTRSGISRISIQAGVKFYF